MTREVYGSTADAPSDSYRYRATYGSVPSVGQLLVLDLVGAAETASRDADQSSIPAVIRSCSVVIVIPSLVSGWVSPHWRDDGTRQR